MCAAEPTGQQGEGLIFLRRAGHVRAVQRQSAGLAFLSDFPGSLNRALSFMIPRSSLAFVVVLLSGMPCFPEQPGVPAPKAPRSQAQNEAPAPSVPNQAASAFARYSGYRIRSVNLQGSLRANQAELLKSIPLQPGQLLDRTTVRASLQQLFATGRFRTIAAEVTPYSDRSLDLNLVV